MTRFFGKVGYTTSTKVSPGIWEDVITEKEYYGDELRNTRYFAQADSVLGKVSFQRRISIVADAYALENYTDIRYAMDRAGAPWIVESVDVERPRLTLLLGERYTGPLPEVEEP